MTCKISKLAKNTFFLLSLLALASGCKTNQAKTTSAEPKAVNAQSDNPLVALCECKNSKGLTLDAYGKSKSEVQKQSLKEYVATISGMMDDPENWFFKDFIQDEVYTSNLMLVSEKFKDTKAFPSGSEDDAQKMMTAITEKYPVCWALLPQMMTLAK